MDRVEENLVRLFLVLCFAVGIFLVLTSKRDTENPLPKCPDFYIGGYCSK